MIKGSWLRAIFFILVNWISISTFAQESKYWVYFSDKKGETFNPETYFHPAAIERREKAGLPLSDSTDFPVSQAYQIELEHAGAKLQNTSRWLNAASCIMTDEVRFKVEQLPFVEQVEIISSIPFLSETSISDPSPDITTPYLPINKRKCSEVNSFVNTN